MSARELNQLMGAMNGIMVSFSSYIIAAVLSTVVLTYGIRWFIFKKAGEKGWKALIPFYSDYINYKIAWDSRIYVSLLVAMVASFLVGAICGWINPVFGSVVSTICNTAVMGAQAIAGMILQFKMARAFGRNDYFAVGLYFLGSVFTAILAFGDAQYKGPTQDGIGVPKFVNDLGQKASAAAANAASAAAQQLQQHQQQQQQGYPQNYPQQPGYPQNYPQAGYPQNYQPQPGYQQPGYPPQPQQAAPRAGRRTQRNSGQYDQFNQ
ncbi:MAG: hypothetical protein IJ461_11135 [Clostridia bacterium]|nr:hypothetical protein [Clostridia bacterium]